MFRLRSITQGLRRHLHGGPVNRDQVLKQLQVCSAKEQVFDVVGKYKAMLTVDHVSCAVSLLWQFQKKKPQLLRTVENTKGHPEFLTLRVLAENKIALMDDLVLVDMLYIFLRLNVEKHDSLVQQLMSEAWKRLERLPMASLSKFSVCIYNQHLHHSPLMGKIASILDQKLSSIDNPRILSAIMISVAPIVSPRLREALISKADHLLELVPNPSNYNNPRRMLQFVRGIKHAPPTLLEKCNAVFLHNVSRMDAENINMILGLCQYLQLNNWDFRLAAKQRLIELLDLGTDSYTFPKLFISLAPMASPELKQRLENTAQLLVDELDPYDALYIAETLEGIHCRNLSLLNKIAFEIQRNLRVYKSTDMFRVTQALLTLQCQNPELLKKLRDISIKFLENNFSPYEVTMLIRMLSLLPNSRGDDRVVSRIVAVMSQCNLDQLSTIAFTVAIWVRNDTSYHHSTPSKYVSLLQALTRCFQERLRTATQLDLVLEELKYISGEWFEEMLLEETIAMLQRMAEQLNWTNVSEMAFFLNRIKYLCPPLMDHITNLAIEHMDKIHYSEIYALLLPFSVLNYEPVRADELYDACIKHFTPHISSFDPYLLVMLAYSLAEANRFPEELSRRIFSIDFLGRLDSQLETLSEALNLRTRLRLMQFNRAVCLECPEFQVPWFHERYCQHVQMRWNSNVSPVRQQIHKMLSEVLGGINYVQAGVVTPYFYTIDFECKLDRHLQPLPYSKPKMLQMLDRGTVGWDVSSLESARDELPPGAQRVAVDFVDSKSFCKNSHHMQGQALMKKRHLEILGYRVVQIPHFEWNSMELSTHDAWKDYLKNKIFG